MNRKQAKQRFTKITKIKASRNELLANASNKVWLCICLDKTIAQLWGFDTRKTEFWVTLVDHIESNCSLKVLGK